MPSRARRTAVAPVPHPTSSAHNEALPAREENPEVGKSQVGAQPALGRLEVGGILVRAALEAFTVGLGSHLMLTPDLEHIRLALNVARTKPEQEKRVN